MVHFSGRAAAFFVVLLQWQTLHSGGHSMDPVPPHLPAVDDLPLYRIGELEPSIGFYQAIEMVPNSLIYAKQSKFQSIEVHQSRFFGKVLVIDECIQLTERDADSYNEMMAHVPMFQHRDPKRVLIIGTCGSVHAIYCTIMIFLMLNLRAVL
jgi:hypothetical protein